VDTNTGKACIPMTVLCSCFVCTVFLCISCLAWPPLTDLKSFVEFRIWCFVSLLQLWHVKMSKANFNELMRSFSLSFYNLIVCQLAGEQSWWAHVLNKYLLQGIESKVRTSTGMFLTFVDRKHKVIEVWMSIGLWGPHKHEWLILL
jgi:hypothetical protein